MKCELCHQHDAETALTRLIDGKEDEIYVCKACAQAEKRAKQKRSQRTRKESGLPPGLSISVTSASGEEPPPIIGALLNAVHGMVNVIENDIEGLEAAKDKKAERGEKKTRKEEDYVYPTNRVDRAYRIGDYLHLEGLNLIGEMEAVKRAAHALGMELVGVSADGVKESGHAYKLSYTGAAEQAGRMVEALVEQERNARKRLIREMPRVLADSVGRALAVLKNCRLLASGELFDLLSAMRLAALYRLLDGITLRRLETMLGACDLTNAADRLEQEERDRVDAERADEINALFEDVMLNDRAEGLLK